jgi:glutaredoxin 2
MELRFSFLLLPKKLNRLLLPDDLTVPLLIMERGRSLILSLDLIEQLDEGVARELVSSACSYSSLGWFAI